MHCIFCNASWAYSCLFGNDQKGSDMTSLKLSISVQLNAIIISVYKYLYFITTRLQKVCTFQIRWSSKMILDFSKKVSQFCSRHFVSRRHYVNSSLSCSLHFLTKNSVPTEFLVLQRLLRMFCDEAVNLFMAYPHPLGTDHSFSYFKINPTLHTHMLKMVQKIHPQNRLFEILVSGPGLHY